MSKQDLTLLREIVLWLHRQQEILERESPSRLSSDARTLYAVIASSWRKIESDRALEQVLQTTEGGLKSRYLYLEPTPRDNAVPVLSFTYNWNLSMPQVSLRLGLFLFDDQKNLSAIGYRFECPHGLGNHHFYHAQPIRSFGGVPMPQCPNWLPERQPSFALDASDSITLLVCLLISLYGFDYIDQLRSTPFGENLIKRMEDKMVLMNSEWQPTYWRVEFTRRTEFYMTHMKRDKFKTIMRIEYSANNISSIERKEYFAQEERRRKEI